MKKVEEVLEGLREEERRLSVELSGVRRAIAALEEVMGTAPAQVPERTETTAPPNAVAPAPAATPGPYAILSFYEAAVDYLTAAGEPRSAREIAEALRAGGYPTQAKDFTATVRTMLSRNLSTEPFGIVRSADRSLWFVRMPDADDSIPSVIE
jgi:hypothetical protein